MSVVASGLFFFFSSRRRHTRSLRDWSSDVCSSDLNKAIGAYNGGVKTPNPAYAAGVKTVAEYARRVLEHATALDDPSASAKSLAVASSEIGRASCRERGQIPVRAGSR